MKQLKLILITMVLVVMSGCAKKSTVTIQAHNLVNPADGSHYANKRFVITEISYQLFGQSKGKTVVDDYFDANGHAQFELKMKKNKDYMFDIEYLDDVCYLDLKTEDFLDHTSVVDINFNYAPCGWVNVPTNNVNCEGVDDKMQYRYYVTDNPDIYIYRGFGDNLSWSEITFVNGCVSYPGGYNHIPVGDYTFEWRVIRPSGTTTGIDYFTVTEGDTTTYLLEY